MLSPDDAATSHTDSDDAALAPKNRARRLARMPSRPTFELRCADVHPSSCEETLRARSVHDLVAIACEHGALVHGFTPVWYSPQRLAAIAAALTTRPA